MKYFPSILTVLISASSLVWGQSESARQGIDVGPLVIRPSVDLEAVYDDRAVLFDDAGSDGDGDFYSQWTGGARVSNGDARYGLSLAGEYGRRYYTDYPEANDDFYRIQGDVGSGEDQFQWGLSSSLSKSLSYNTAVDSSTGESPEGILTDGESKNFVANAGVSYQINLSERTIVTPYLGASHFFQDFERGTGDAEWQIYSAGSELGFAFSQRTLFTLSADYSQQVNDDEDGSVASVTVGTRSRISETIVWNAEVGLALAQYDESGSETGLTGELQLLWQVTDKISSYAFAGQDYLPGYDGSGAREVYRAGYGADWQLTPRWSFSGQGLHNYEESVGDSAVLFNGVEHFYSISTRHTLTDRASVSCGISFANDEYEIDQLVYFLRLSAAL